MTSTAIAFNTTTGDIWSGPAPTHATWDPFWQLFSFDRPEGAIDATPDDKQAVRDYLNLLLQRPPTIRRPGKDGIIKGHCFHIGCLSCQSPNLRVPVQTCIDASSGLFLGWFGKGACTCLDCGASNTSAKIKPLGMYDFAQLTYKRQDEFANRLEQWV